MESYDITGISDIIKKLRMPPTLMFENYEDMQDYIKRTPDEEIEVGTLVHVNYGASVPQVQEMLKKSEKKYPKSMLASLDIHVVYFKQEKGWELFDASFNGHLEADGSIRGGIAPSCPSETDDSME